MNHTDRIAVKLFGWKFKSTGYNFSGSRWISPAGHEANISLTGESIFDPSGQWPDLTDWNWIRKMEDAIDEKDLLMMYICNLQEETKMRRDVTCLRATPAQRVAACLKVLEECKK